MPEPVESISSRELALWLFLHADMLEGQWAAIRALADDHDCNLFNATDQRIQEIRDCAQWLREAKFEVRDPWRLRVAVKAVLDTEAGYATSLCLEKLAALRVEFEPFKGNL